jgi:cytosine deaminase
MITSRAASALGIANHGIEVGNDADFCIHAAERVVDVLRDHAPPVAVYRRGALIAETDPPETRWGG